jgi:hypothetical protein
MECTHSEVGHWKVYVMEIIVSCYMQRILSCVQTSADCRKRKRLKSVRAGTNFGSGYILLLNLLQCITVTVYVVISHKATITDLLCFPIYVLIISE